MNGLLQSAFLRLNRNDFLKAAVTAAFAGVVIALAGIVTQPNFDLFTVDWASVLKTAVNAGFAAFVGYLGKNLVTDSQGKMFGRL